MKTEGQELEFHGGYLNGFLMCAIDIVLYAATIGALVKGCVEADAGRPCAIWFVMTGVLFIAAIIFSCGFSMLEPNEAKVMTFAI